MRTFTGRWVHDDDVEFMVEVDNEGASICYRPWGSDDQWGPKFDLTETTQGWVVFDHVTDGVISKSYDKEEHANSVCREFNRTQGAGGRYGVRREDR